MYVQGRRNHRYPHGEISDDGCTALHLACVEGSVEALRVFGRDERCTASVVNRRDSGGFTPLMEAVVHGNLGMYHDFTHHR